jgi:hypothetical protein
MSASGEFRQAGILRLLLEVYERRKKNARPRSR